jgi:hypothetical protein
MSHNPSHVLLEILSPTNSILEAVEVPAHQVERQARLKWESLPLDQQISGVAVRAVTNGGDVLCIYWLRNVARRLYGDHVAWPVHMLAAKLYLMLTTHAEQT